MNTLPFTLSKDNPFRERIEKSISVGTVSGDGQILNEKITIVRERQYLNGPWVRLGQNTEMLRDLTPWGWYILGHIALNIGFNQEKIKLSCIKLGMTRRMYRRTMLEMLSLGIIANTKRRSVYWINVGILVMGAINKHESEK